MTARCSSSRQAGCIDSLQATCISAGNALTATAHARPWEAGRGRYVAGEGVADAEGDGDVPETATCPRPGVLRPIR